MTKDEALKLHAGEHITDETRIARILEKHPNHFFVAWVSGSNATYGNIWFDSDELENYRRIQ